MAIAAVIAIFYHPPPPASASLVNGTIKAIDKPIPNVKVMLIVEKDGIINDVTDPTGQFFFENVPIGMHLFEVLGGHDAVQYSKRVPVIRDQPFVNMHIIQIGVEVPSTL